MSVNTWNALGASRASFYLNCRDQRFAYSKNKLGESYTWASIWTVFCGLLEPFCTVLPKAGPLGGATFLYVSESWAIPWVLDDGWAQPTGFSNFAAWVIFFPMFVFVCEICSFLAITWRSKRKETETRCRNSLLAYHSAKITEPSFSWDNGEATEMSSVW